MSLRCFDCQKVYTDAELDALEAESGSFTSCPACGSRALPQNPAYDITVAINWHDLRTLTIWATNWAMTMPDSQAATEPARDALRKIIIRLRNQHPDLSQRAPLTLAEEIGRLRQAFGGPDGSNVQVSTSLAKQEEWLADPPPSREIP